MICSTPDSTNIARYGWENGSLFVEFKKGACWQYAEVPFEKYTDMTQAPSVGSFFAREIKPHYVAKSCEANPFA